MIDPEKLRAATKAADDYLARLTDTDFVRRRKRLFALAAAASGGDVKQAPAESPQSGGDSRNAQPPSDRIEQLNQGGSK